MNPEILLNEQELALDVLQRRLAPSLRRHRDALIQIYGTEMSRGVLKPKPIGSGVLVHLSGEHFLLSAGHVLKHFVNQPPITYVGHNNSEPVVLDGDVKVEPELPGFENKYRNGLDVGVIKLRSAAVGELRSANFLSIVDLAQAPISDSQPKYVSTGFPETKTDVIVHLKRLKVRSLSTICKLASFEDAMGLGFSNDTHIIYRYDKKLRYQRGNNNTESPDPEGMSGGGFFYLPNIFRILEKEVEWKLIGIIIQSHRTELPYRLNVVVRIACFIDFIVHHFSHLADARRGRQPVAYFN